MKKNNESFKESAKVYFWTFILVLILNQVLFFGACLNAVCLVAALPHVSIISFFLGRYIIRSEIENKNIGSKLDATKAKKNEKQSLVDEEKKRLLESLELDEDLKSLKVSFKSNTTKPDNAQVDSLKVNISKDLSKVPQCPVCHLEMKLRTAKKGRFAGTKFWGCQRYPQCNGIINVFE